MPNPVELSPAIDIRTDKVVVIMQDRPVVGMSAWLVDALAAAESEGLGLQLVTPATTRLTFAARTTLFMERNSRWVITEPNGEGAYDGLGGSRLKWDGEMFAAVAAGEGEDKVDMSPTFAAVDFDQPFQLWITARFRYQALETTVVGQAAELLFEELTGAKPAGWGTAEPVTQPWNVGQLTKYCRRRAPKPTWLAVVGGKDGLSSTGSVEIHRRPAGLEEIVTMAVATPDGLPSPEDVQRVGAKLADAYTLVSFFAQGAHGANDTNAMPHWTGVPAPMAMAVGNDAVKAEGLTKAMDMTGVADIKPAKIGPSATPGVWYPIGDGKNQLDWNVYSALLRRLVPSNAPARA